MCFTAEASNDVSMLTATLTHLVNSPKVSVFAKFQLKDVYKQFYTSTVSKQFS